MSEPRILLVRLSAIGDCLHAVPVLVHLRERFPKAHIGWAIEKAPYSLLKGHPLVDIFHLYPRDAFNRKEGKLRDRMGHFSAFRRELREQRYEIALDLQGLTKSGLVSWWSNAKRRIGFRGADSRELNLLFNNERVIPDAEAVHVVERNLCLLVPLGVPRPDKPGWVLPDYREEQELMDRFLRDNDLFDGTAGRPFATINPGATWETKRWPIANFGMVARGFREQAGMPIVVTWGAPDEKLAAETIVEMGGPGMYLAPPTSLRELAALLSRTQLYIGNDSGPLHLAVALGKPCVSIFGASDPLRNGPYGNQHRIESGGPDCQPCWKTSCHRNDMACLHWVKVESVLDASLRLLKSVKASGE